MRRKVRSILSIITIILVIVSIVSPMQEGKERVLAASTTVNTYTWKYELVEKDNVTYAKIISVDIHNTQNLIIPSKLDSYPVGVLGDSLFKNNESLVNVTIPSTLYEIGGSAFYQCKSLKNIKVSKGNETLKNVDFLIGGEAFRNCFALEEYQIGKNVNKLDIRSEAFGQCENLEWEVFPCEVKISRKAFSQCRNIKNLTFKENAKLVGACFGGAFQEEEGIEKRVIFEKDMQLDYSEGENGPLADCSGLTEITILGQAKLCDFAFTRDINLRKITFGKGLLNTSRYLFNTFAGCYALETMEFIEGDIDFEQFPIGVNSLGLKNIIFKGDTSINYFFDAENVIFEKGVKVTDGISISPSKTKNVFFYSPNVDLANLGIVAGEGKTNIYGLANTDAEALAQRRPDSTEYKDIVETINVSYQNELAVKEGSMVKNITTSAIALQVEAKYVGKEGFIPVAPSDNIGNGYVLSHGTLVKGVNNTATVTYSKKSKDIGVKIRDRVLTSIQAESKQGETVIEGMPLKKEQVTVTAYYEGASQGEEIEDFTIGEQTTQIGKNTMSINYKGQSTTLEVTGVEKQLVSVEAKYEGEDVIVGHEIDLSKLFITAFYNNNTSEKVSQYYINNIVEQVGENQLLITYKGYETYVIVKGLENTVESIHASYNDAEVVEGMEVKNENITVTAYLKDGKKVEHIQDFMLSPYLIAVGTNTVQINYAGKTANIIVKGIAKAPSSAEVICTIATAIEGTFLTKNQVQVTVKYNDGTTEIIQSPKIEIASHSIVLGENSVIVKYEGKDYIVHVVGVENQLLEIRARYIEKPLTIGESIHLEDIELVAYYADGTMRTITSGYSILGNAIVTLEGENKKEISYNGKQTELVVEVKGSQTETPTQTEKPSQTESPTQTEKPIETQTPASTVLKLTCNIKKVTFTENKKDTYNVYAKENMKVTFTSKNLSKLQYQLVKKGSSAKEGSWKSVSNNKLTINKECSASVLYIRYLDAKGKQIIKKTVGFYLDKSAPTVSGIKHKGTYKKAVTLRWSDKISGVGKATLNGKTVKSGVKVKKKGSYTFIVTDKAGNKVTKKFVIKK